MAQYGIALNREVFLVQVAELRGKVSTLQMALEMNVRQQFELLGTSEENRPDPILLERLKQCCLVVDALGYKVGQLIELFISLFLP